MRFKNRNLIVMAGLFLLSLLFVSCEKDNPAVEDDQDQGFNEEDVNEWIYEWMNTIYLWEDKIPQELNPREESDPEGFFRELIYTEEDRWSFVTDDFESFYAELSGTPTSMGFSPAFGRVPGEDQVFIVIEYVTPDSPADAAGLKRGDIVLTIDGNQMDIQNYISLYNQSSYTAGLGKYDGDNFILTGETVSLTAEVINTKPVIHSEIIDYQNKKIGYLVYVDFISGVNGVLVNELDAALAEFSDEGIDELIVDLRYNPGGEVSMASYLASAIAPGSVADPSNLLVSYVYNDYLTQAFIQEGGENSEDLNLFFTNTAFNLDMNSVYFMTGSGTASASELVITGLDPYMDVVVVGDTTVGKYTGAWVFPDTENPPRHNYAIVPIVLKYANSQGNTEFKDGLYPDYPVNDMLLGAESFGSFSDPILAKTLEVMTGVSPITARKKVLKAPQFTMLPFRERIQKKSIHMIHDLPEKN